MNRKIKLYDAIYFVIFSLLIISELFSISFFCYFDEILAVLCIIYLFIQFLNKKTKEINFLFIGIFLLIIIGLLGNLTYTYGKTSFKIILLDIFMFLKPYVFFGASYCFIKIHYSEGLRKSLSIFSKIIILTLFVFALNYAIKNGIYYEKISKNRFTFYSGFTGAIANITIICICLINCKKSIVDFIYYIISAYIIFMTGSGLGLLGILIVFFFNYFIRIIKFKWYYLIPFSLIAFICSWSEFAGYILDTSTARSNMYQYSFVTANNFFPFGSGFALYGSYGAGHYYSYLYLEYGFENIWGLTMDSIHSHNNFLFDAYYPMILGQFGYFGLTIFLFILFKMVQLIIKKSIFFGKRMDGLAIAIYIIVMGIGFNIGGVEGCLLCMCLGFDMNKRIMLAIK